MLKILALVALMVVAIALVVRRFEPALAFFPAPGAEPTPADLGLAFESTTLATADGERLRAWLLPSPDARAVVLYFHGNGGNLPIWLPILAEVRRRGLTVAAIDYRGYGESTGRPSERGVYRDADAAVAWVEGLVEPDVPLVYWGRSLGTSVAAYAATRRRPDRLILEAGFPGARSLFRRSPLALLALFSSYRFPTAEFASDAGCHVLVVHGDQDDVIPLEQGQALYRAIRDPRQFFVVRGGGHNDLAAPDPEEYWRSVLAFIEG